MTNKLKFVWQVGVARWKWGWAIFVLGFGAVAACVVVVAAVRAGELEGAPEAGPVVATEVVREEDGYDVSVGYLGRVEAARRSRVGFELGGVVSRVAVDVGDRVEAGHVLAELDTVRLEAARAEAEGNLRAAEADWTLAASELERARALGVSRVASAREVEQAVRERDAAAARRDAAASGVERIDADLAKARLVAPFRGTVVARHRDEGEGVAVGEPIVEVLETERLRVRVGVSPEIADGWSTGERVFSAGGEEVVMVVERVAPARDLGTRTVEVLLAVESGEVRDGDFVRVGGKRRVGAPGFWLPREALAEAARGLWGCYAVVGGEASETVELRPVEVLHESGGRVFVRGALRDGERVVTLGAHKLVPGVRVREAAGLSAVSP